MYFSFLSRRNHHHHHHRCRGCSSCLSSVGFVGINQRKSAFYHAIVTYHQKSNVINLITALRILNHFGWLVLLCRQDRYEYFGLENRQNIINFIKNRKVRATHELIARFVAWNLWTYMCLPVYTVCMCLCQFSASRKKYTSIHFNHMVSLFV